MTDSKKETIEQRTDRRLFMINGNAPPADTTKKDMDTVRSGVQTFTEAVLAKSRKRKDRDACDEEQFVVQSQAIKDVGCQGVILPLITREMAPPPKEMDAPFDDLCDQLRKDVCPGLAEGRFSKDIADQNADVVEDHIKTARLLWGEDAAAEEDKDNTSGKDESVSPGEVQAEESATQSTE